MYCNVTKQIQAGLDRLWEEASISDQLSKAISVKEYLAVLQEHSNWNTFSFSLRRYIYLRFTQRSPEEKAVSYSVLFEGKSYDFTPVTPDAEISEQEMKDYAELLYRITLHRGCFKRDKKGRVDPKKGAISKDDYLKYLNGQRPYRHSLFPISVALNFDREMLTQFMNVLGESPVYNFRNAVECIYYFCQSVPSLNTWETVEELVAYYERIQGNEDPGQFVGIGMTEQLNYEIGEIACGDDLTDLERKEAFKTFLKENASQFAQYSRSARELLTKELCNKELLDTRKHGDESQRVNAAFLCVDDANELMVDPGFEGQTIFDEVFGRLYRLKCGKQLQVRALNLDKSMTRNLTNSPHLRKVYAGALFSEEIDEEIERKLKKMDAGKDEEEEAEERVEERMEEPVRKQDFLLARLKKFDVLVKQFDYTPEERLALMKRFRASTDRILDLAGLPGMYVGNPLDHMILTALCQPDPAEFTQELYFRATKEGAE